MSGKYISVLDPRMESLSFASKDNKYGVFKGTESQNVQQNQANSYGQSGISFNFNTNSSNVLIDRRIYIRCQFLCTFTGLAPVGQKLLNTGSDAPRCLPLASITQDLKININGQSITSQYNSSLQAFLRYNLSKEERQTSLSMSPSMMDNSQRYVDQVNGLKNPLADYQNSGAEEGRGCFVYDNIVNPASVDPAVPIVASVLFTVTEPILCSPLLWNAKQLESALIGVQNMGFNFSFNGNLNRVWSRSPSAGVTIQSMTTSIGQGSTSPPSCLITYLSPPLLSISQIPEKSEYQYYKVNTNVTDMAVSLASNATQVFTNNAMQLSTVPRSIYIYASRSDNTRSHLTTDSFFRINSLSLNYLNTSGQFSSCSIQDLYAISVKNGCNMSWNEWSGRCVNISESTGPGRGSVDGLTGSVLKIDISDLAVPSNVSVGMQVNSQLNFSIGLENVNRVDNIPVQITTVLVYDSIMTISNNNMNLRDGIISENEVVELRADRDNYVDWVQARNIFAGSLYSNIGHYASMGKKGLDAVCKLSNMMSGNGGRCPKGQQKALECRQEPVCKPRVKKGKGGQLLTRDQLKYRMFD